MGLWSAGVMWARRDLRRRWRSLIALGMLAAVTSGFAMAAFAGARRTETALVRLKTVTNAADAAVFASQVSDLHPGWARLEARPEVKQLAVWDLLFGDLDGQPGLLFASDHGKWLGTVDKPVVLAGRMFNPRSDDEMVVNEQVVSQDHVGLGAVIHLKTYATDQPSASGTPHGPAIDLRVVGVVRTADEFLFTPNGLVSPGVAAHYRHEIVLLPNAMVRLVHGEADMAALRRDANALVAPGVPVLDLDSASRRVTTTLDVERFALLMTGLAIVLAGGLLVAQVLARSASAIGDDVGALRAMGMTRVGVAVAAGLSHLPVVAIALGAGLGGAVAISPLFPVGAARTVDPDVGLHADWTVLGVGLSVTLVFVAGAIIWLAVATLGREAGRRARRSPLAAWLGRAAPLPVGIGARMALERGPGARSMPVRPALVGAVVGVLGAVGALTVDGAIHYALANPTLAGVSWGATILPPSQDVVGPNLVGRVERAAPGASVALGRRETIDVNGVGVPTFCIRSLTPRRAPVTLVTVRGHAPSGPDEAAIGPATAKVLGVHIGEWVEVGGRHRARLVGEALFPSDVHAEFDEGLWLTTAGFGKVAPSSATAASDQFVAVRFPDAGGQESVALADAEADPAGNPVLTGPIGRLVAGLGGPASPLGSAVTPVSVPLELTNLEDLSQLPTVLGVFLASLGLAALSYVLFVSGRSRRADFAVFKALGVSGRTSRAIVLWQATVISSIGLLVGVPLGVAAGRWGWRAIADRVPLVDVPPVPVLVVVLALPVVLVAGNVVAAWPARRAALTRPVEALRVE